MSEQSASVLNSRDPMETLSGLDWSHVRAALADGVLAIADSYSEDRVLEYRALAMLAYRLNQ